MRVFIALVIVFFIGVIAVGASTSQTDTGTSRPPAAAATYAPSVVARAGAMTEQMSIDGPISGHEYHGHTGDEQLRLSTDPEFAREVASYQQQVDQMLARNR